MKAYYRLHSLASHGNIVYPQVKEVRGVPPCVMTSSCSWMIPRSFLLIHYVMCLIFASSWWKLIRIAMFILHNKQKWENWSEIECCFIGLLKNRIEMNLSRAMIE
jgi:hypothetical protein